MLETRRHGEKRSGTSPIQTRGTVQGSGASAVAGRRHRELPAGSDAGGRAPRAGDQRQAPGRGHRALRRGGDNPGVAGTPRRVGDVSGGATARGSRGAGGARGARRDRAADHVRSDAGSEASGTGRSRGARPADRRHAEPDGRDGRAAGDGTQGVSTDGRGGQPGIGRRRREAGGDLEGVERDRGHAGRRGGDRCR